MSHFDSVEPDDRARLDRLDAVRCSETLNSRFRSHLRFVETSDAGYIFSLRADPSLNLYLNAPSTDVNRQRIWIADYKLREARGREFYFVIVSDGENRGVVRLYDFRTISGETSFSWGSWIIPPPRLPGIVTFSAIMVYELGFDVLSLDRAHFEVTKSNIRVLEFHRRSGATLESEDANKVYFRFDPIAYARFRQASEQQIRSHRIIRVLTDQ